jgi:hypothetical protein
MLFRVIGLVFERHDVLKKIRDRNEEISKAEQDIINISLPETFHYCLYNLSLVSKLIMRLFLSLNIFQSSF